MKFCGILCHYWCYPVICIINWLLFPISILPIVCLLRYLSFSCLPCLASPVYYVQYRSCPLTAIVYHLKLFVFSIVCLKTTAHTITPTLGYWDGHDGDISNQRAPSISVFSYTLLCGMLLLVHSLMLSLQYFLCLSLLRLPSAVPCRIS